MLSCAALVRKGAPVLKRKGWLPLRWPCEPRLFTSVCVRITRCGNPDRERNSRSSGYFGPMAKLVRVARIYWAVCALCALCAFTLPQKAEGQVNIEPVRKQLATTGFGARLRLSISSYQGNTHGLVAGASGLVGSRLERHLGFINASWDYAHLGGETSVQKSFAHVRHNFRVVSWLWWEEFVQSETDRFRRIQLRALVGTGPRLGLLESERIDLYYGTSYMLEYTDVNPASDRREPKLVQRWNNYLALNYRPDDRIALSSVSYYQPRLGEFSDARILNVSGAEFKITELLQSRIDTITRYESRPAERVKRTDIEFKSSLELKF